MHNAIITSTTMLAKKPLEYSLDGHLIANQQSYGYYCALCARMMTMDAANNYAHKCTICEGINNVPAQTTISIVGQKVSC